MVKKLCVILPKMSACRRDFDETIYMSFLIKNEEWLLEKCNEIWDKVSNTIKKGFDRESAYNEKFLRTEMKYYKEKIIINFYYSDEK